MSLKTLFCLLISCVAVEAEIKTFPAPTGAPVAAGRRVTVSQDGQSLVAPVYDTTVQLVIHGRNTGNPFNTEAQKAYFSSFELSGKAVVSLKVEDKVVTSATVRPLSRKISASVADNTVTFEVDRPGPLTVELNGDVAEPLHLFVNPPESDVPAGPSDKVIYYGPGFYPDVGIIQVKSGETLYIAGGAYLQKASISVENAKNVTVRGRGIVDTAARMFGYKKTTALPPEQAKKYEVNHCISVDRVDTMTTEGLIFLDSGIFCSPYRRSKNISVSNVKVIASDSNTDQISVLGSQRVHISNVFVRGHDDGIVIKTGVSVKGYAVKDVLVEDSVIWTDVGHSLAIGFEILEELGDVTFRNIDVLHVDGGDGACPIDVVNIDNGLVHDLTFSDIRIEGDLRKLFRLQIMKSKHSVEKNIPGRIRNVVLENIDVVNSPFPASIFKGFNKEHGIDGVLIRNLTVNGKRVTNPQDGKFEINEFVRGLEFAKP